MSPAIAVGCGGAVLLLSLLSCASARELRRAEVEYAVRWQHDGPPGAGQAALLEEADQHLREALRGCGRGVTAGPPPPLMLTLRLGLEVRPGGLELRVVGLREGRLVGTFTAKASGASRRAQLRAVVSGVCDEARRLE